jgi:hypothetical protein
MEIAHIALYQNRVSNMGDTSSLERNARMEFQKNPARESRDTAKKVHFSLYKVHVIIDRSQPNMHCL